MQRLVAGLAIVAFLAACSDSSTTAPRQLHPGTARFSFGDPPPPPLSGSGFGFADAGFTDFATTAAATTTVSPSPCVLAHHFNLTYTFSYLMNKTGTNEMAHLDLTGTTTGQVNMHDMGLGNGKSNATGKVQDADFVFDITDGDGSIDAVTAQGTVTGNFEYTLSGMLTQLSTGQKCPVTGVLSGGFTQVVVID